MLKIIKKKTSHGPKRPVEAPIEPPPEILKVVEEEFPEEDTATKREHFERIIEANASKVFAGFVDFVWRQGAGITQVEILKEASKPGTIEAGMTRRLMGYEEEVILVKKDRMIEYKILDGMPASYHKSRVLLMPEDDGAKTRVIWTIWWSPTSLVAGIAYTVMMTGYCNMALYRLASYATSGEVPSIEPQLSTTSEGMEVSGDDSSDMGFLPEGEIPKLQWAARMQTGYEGNLTADQEQALIELQTTLQNSDPEVWELCQKHPDGPNRIMLRFLRAECSGKARKFHVEKSRKRLGDTLRYRREMKADELLTRTPPKFKEFTESGGELVLTDKEGRVTVFTRAGLLSTCLDTRIMTEDEWRTNLVCVTERRMQILRENSKRLGHEVSATVCVYDVRGIGFASRKIIPFTKVINDVASKHYPELVDMIIVTFAPSLFTTLFASIKSFLDPVTASKVRVFGTGKHEVEKMKSLMRSLVDPKILPREFGGDSTVEVGYPALYKGEKYSYE